MTDPDSLRSPLLYPAGTQVVTQRAIIGAGGRIVQPQASVGVIVRAPTDLEHQYLIRFPEGFEAAFRHGEFVTLTRFQSGELSSSTIPGRDESLFDRVIFRCVIGSRAYGLEDDQSDTDYRGIFLPHAERHWSLPGVPSQIECHETQEHYWEIQRFLILALKANPNVLECLYSPLVELTTPLADELLALRGRFLSQLVYQTFNGYVLSQFKKMQADLRNQGMVKWKHVMHLLRLLISGIYVLREGTVSVQVREHRDQLLAIKRGEVPWEEAERWRLKLHAEFELAQTNTSLPERPDYDSVNTFLIKARRTALET